MSARTWLSALLSCNVHGPNARSQNAEAFQEPLGRRQFRPIAVGPGARCHEPFVESARLFPVPGEFGGTGGAEQAVETIRRVLQRRFEFLQRLARPTQVQQQIGQEFARRQNRTGSDRLFFGGVFEIGRARALWSVLSQSW